MTTQSKTIILTFVRHGQTDANFKRIIDGQGLDCPLNDVGLQQSKAKTFWKIESPNAISWIHLGGTAKKFFFQE